MTDKQIIIDGVDVSGCEYIIPPHKQCPNKPMPYAKETSCFACKEHNTKLNFCKNNLNCNYKQLKRSEAQCEAMFVSHTDLEKKYKRKEQECEELKRANLHIENNREHKANKLNRIEKLILACTTGYTDEFIQELLVILHEPEPSSFENKYKQTLTEIKEIASREAETSRYNGSFTWKQILQKISEVLE